VAARVDATPVVVVSERAFRECLVETSAWADFVLLGFELPAQAEETAWSERYEKLLLGMPPTFLVCSQVDCLMGEA
jgi:hypothetical protein